MTLTARDYVMTITNGTVTKTFTSTPFSLYRYIPKEPANNADTVSETCIIRVTDGTVDANREEIQAIQSLLDDAWKSNPENPAVDPSIAKVYVTLKTSAGGTDYRAQLKLGKTEYDDEAMNYAQWTHNLFLVTLSWTREIWETVSEVQIALDNLLDTANTTGLKIYNPNITRTSNTIAFVSGTKKITDSGNGLIDFKTGATIQIVNSAANDGTKTIATGGVAGEIVTNEALSDEGASATVTILGPTCNYVEIPAAQVTTVIDAPIRLEITNGPASTYKDIYAGISHMADIANMVWFFEGEDGSAGTGASASTVTESYLCSGGFYNKLDWIEDTEKELRTWPLTAAMLAACRGGYLRAMIRMQGNVDATMQFKVSIKLSTTTVWASQLITAKASSQKQDLGIIQLPPELFGQTAPKALTLALTCKQAGGGTLNLDFLELFPNDSFRALRSLSYSIATGDQIVIDDLLNPSQVYGVDSGSKKYPIWIKRGSPLMVQNNTKQRIYILFDLTGGTWYNFLYSTVKVYYRPRRLSL